MYRKFLNMIVFDFHMQRDTVQLSDCFFSNKKTQTNG